MTQPKMKITMNKSSYFIVIISLLIFLNACQKNQYKVDSQSTSPSEKSETAENKSWKLIPEFSSISIISTKNNSISEVFDFTAFSGDISSDGQLSVIINLTSLETMIPIRNERIQKHLFQTDIYPTADIRAQIQKTDLSVGVHNLSFDVDLHGLSALLEAEFMVFELNGNKVVTLRKPLIITAGTFGLENGITTLRNIARLDSINLTVPLNIVLTFEAQ